MLKFLSSMFFCAVLMGMPLLGQQSVFIDFEGLEQDTPVIDQFIGITVTGGFIATDPITTPIGDLDIDPDGENSLGAGLEGALDAVGPLEIVFDFDVENLSFEQANFAGTLTVDLFDSSGLLLAQESLTTGDVTQLQRVLSSSGVRRIVLNYVPVDPNFCCFVIDDLSFDRTGIAVAIDIKPHSDPNSINLGSAGVIPVAIISTEDFDATAEVDPATITLNSAPVRLIGRGDRTQCSSEDVNGDGLDDLVCHVETAEFMIEEGVASATLEALTYSGTSVTGGDAVRIVP